MSAHSETVLIAWLVNHLPIILSVMCLKDSFGFVSEMYIKVQKPVMPLSPLSVPLLVSLWTDIVL